MTGRRSKTQPPEGDAPKNSDSGFGSILQMFVIAIVLIVANNALWPRGTEAVASDTGIVQAGAAQGIVVVDAKAILKTYLDTQTARIAAGESFTEESLKMSGVDFAAEFLRAVKKYRDAGYLVFDKSNALGVPRGSEITLEIADALGVEVQLPMDPLDAPSVN